MQEAGAPAYWVVDPERAHVEVWTPPATEPRIERDRLTWHPDGAPTPLTLDLPILFTPR